MRDQRITNQAYAKRLGVPDLRVVGRRCSRWLGHVARNDENRRANIVRVCQRPQKCEDWTSEKSSFASQIRSRQASRTEPKDLGTHSTRETQTSNALCTERNLTAPKCVPANPQLLMICDKCFTRVGMHIATAHPLNTAKFECRVSGCGATSETKKFWTRHLASAHTIKTPEPFGCTVHDCKCGPFQTNGHLLARLRRRHAAAQ